MKVIVQDLEKIEYIVFGNATPSKNITTTKASIYGIRVIFNSIFAFTEPKNK